MQFLNESFIDDNAVSHSEDLASGSVEFTASDLLPAELCFMRATESVTLSRAWYPE